MSTPIVIGVPIPPIATATPRIPVRTGVRLPDGTYVLRSGLASCATSASAANIVERPGAATRYEMNEILNDDDERIAIACVESRLRIQQLYTYELQALVDSGLSAADREDAHWTPFLDALSDGLDTPPASGWDRIRQDQRRSIWRRLTRLARWIGRQQRWQRILPLCGFESLALRDLIVRNGNQLPVELIAHLVASDVSLLIATASHGRLSPAAARWALNAFTKHAKKISCAAPLVAIFLERCASKLPETVEDQLLIAEAIDAVPGGANQLGVRHARDEVISTFRRVVERQSVDRPVLARFATFRDDTLRQFALELLRHVRSCA